MSTPLQLLSQELNTVVEATAPSLVAIAGRSRRGRGFAATGIHWQNGFIVTSAEAIPAKDSLIVTLPDQSTCRVDRIGTDPTTDIAVFKLSHDVDLPSVTQTTDMIAVGNLLVAVGRDSDRGVFAHLGLVNGVGGPWQSLSGGDIDQFIRVDVNLRWGGAGSALVNVQGQVIGFSTFGPYRTVLTIPAQTISRVVQQLQDKGRISRGYLGLGMQPVKLPEALRQQYSLTNESGIMTISVEPGGSAEQGGIVLGDILVSIDQQVTQDPHEIQPFLTPQNVGKVLQIQLIRGGKLQEISVVVGER